MDELYGQHYGCGCIAYISHIVHCKLHVAAPKLLQALKVLLTNHELGEYESQQRGLPRLIEACDLARNAITLAEEV